LFWSTISIVFDSAISGVYFFFFYGQQDQSAVNELQNRDEIVQLLQFGAFLAHILIYKGFGVAALYNSALVFNRPLFNTQFLLEN
jgi:S-DNA-T family DNA segregation ATPase FtsK/SpoIIIE